MACRLRSRPVSRAIVSKKGGFDSLSLLGEMRGAGRTEVRAAIYSTKWYHISKRWEATKSTQ